MAEYPVNKGIGRSPEFKGLKSQYLFLFAGGLLGLFVLFVVMYLTGINQWLCILFGLTAATALVSGVFRLNARYGEHGLMKLRARNRRPRYIIRRRVVRKLFAAEAPHSTAFRAQRCGPEKISPQNNSNG